MIFGDRSQLAFEIDPVEPSWDRVVHGVSIPLMPVAEWLTSCIRAIAYEESPARARYGVEPHEVLKRWNDAGAPAGIPTDSWEDERYEWYCRHFWLAGVEGALLPDVGLVRADGKLLVSWRQPVFPGPRRLLFSEPPASEGVEWPRAWEALRDFVSWVAGQVRQRSIMQAGWARDESPLEKAAECTAAQFVALTAPSQEGLLEALGVGSKDHPESRPSLLALRDLEISPETRSDVVKVAPLLDRAGGTEDRAARLRDLRAGARTALSGPSPEAVGYDVARWFRSEMGLDGDPIASERLEEIIATIAERDEVPASSVHNSAAVGATSEARAHRGVRTDTTGAGS
jgi:hypothetical protein